MFFIWEWEKDCIWVCFVFCIWERLWDGGAVATLRGIPCNLLLSDPSMRKACLANTVLILVNSFFRFHWNSWTSSKTLCFSMQYPIEARVGGHNSSQIRHYPPPPLPPPPSLLGMPLTTLLSTMFQKDQQWKIIFSCIFVAYYRRQTGRRFNHNLRGLAIWSNFQTQHQKTDIL